MHTLCTRLDRSIQIAERKEFHSKWNHCGSISESRQCKKDDTWWSDFLLLKTSEELLSNFYNMLLDVLAKSRQFRIYTFLLTCSAAELH